MCYSKSDSVHIQYIVIDSAGSTHGSAIDVISSLKMPNQFRRLAFISLLQFLLSSLLNSFCSLLAILFENGSIDKLKVTVLLRDPSSACVIRTHGRILLVIVYGSIRTLRWRLAIQYKRSITMDWKDPPGSGIST